MRADGESCATCGTHEDDCDDHFHCDNCNDIACSSCWTYCDAADCREQACSGCVVEVAARRWECCGLSFEARSYHPHCCAESEEDQHGCVTCDVCGCLTCPAAPGCRTCAAAAEEAPLVEADVRVARDALAAAKSASLRTLLQGWLDEHAGAEDAAGSACAKKRKA